jgi:hypothetical protein
MVICLIKYLIIVPLSKSASYTEGKHFPDGGVSQREREKKKFKDAS